MDFILCMSLNADKGEGIKKIPNFLTIIHELPLNQLRPSVTRKLNLGQNGRSSLPSFVNLLSVVSNVFGFVWKDLRIFGL